MESQFYCLQFGQEQVSKCKEGMQHAYNCSSIITVSHWIINWKAVGIILLQTRVICKGVMSWRLLDTRLLVINNLSWLTLSLSRVKSVYRRKTNQLLWELLTSILKTLKRKNKCSSLHFCILMVSERGLLWDKPSREVDFHCQQEKQESCINFNLILTLSFRQEAPLD